METFLADSQFLTPQQLIDRWGGQVTLATLSTWRSRNNGPPFVKIGGRVLYRLEDVAAYERKNTRGAAKAAAGFAVLATAFERGLQVLAMA